MNQSAAEDAKLEALLRHPGTPLRDDDFTARVLAALPPPQPASQTAPHRLVFVGAGAIVGVALAAVRFGSWSTFEQEWSPLQDSLTQLASTFGEQHALLGLAIAAGSVLFALVRPRPLRALLALPRWR